MPYLHQVDPTQDLTVRRAFPGKHLSFGESKSALNDYHMHGRSQILPQLNLPRCLEGLASERQTSQCVV